MRKLMLIAWRQAETDACKAELAAAVGGSRAGLLQLEARRLRQEADRQFAELLAPSESANEPLPIEPRAEKKPRLATPAT